MTENSPSTVNWPNDVDVLTHGGAGQLLTEDHLPAIARSASLLRYDRCRWKKVAVASENMIVKASAMVNGTPMIVNSRVVATSDSRHYSTQAALSNPYPLGIRDGVEYCLKVAKKNCCVVFGRSMNPAFPTCQSFVKGFLAYMAPIGALENPNFYLVLTTEHGTTINYANPTDPETLSGSLNWIKANYSTGGPGPSKLRN